MMMLSPDTPFITPFAIASPFSPLRYAIADAITSAIIILRLLRHY
jgi:hypothetical protein